VLAAIGQGILVACGLVASWLLPAPANAAQSVVTGNSEYISRNSTDWQILWTGAITWDVRFLSRGKLLATAGPRNVLSFRDLAGNEPAWMLEDAATYRSGEWDLTGRRERIVAQFAGRFTALAFASDKSTLAVAREEASYDDDGFHVREILRDVMLWSLDSSR
jgi:hypothetical protein